MSDRIYFINYMLNSDNKSINTIAFVAQPIFNEVGLYTFDELAEIIKLLHKQKVPKFKKTNTIGTYTYKTMEEWDNFVKRNTKKIEKLIKELRKNDI